MSSQKFTTSEDHPHGSGGLSGAKEAAETDASGSGTQKSAEFSAAEGAAEADASESHKRNGAEFSGAGGTAEKAVPPGGRRRIRSHMNAAYTTISLYVIGTCAILFILLRISYHLPQIGSAIGTFFHYLGVILKPLLAGLAIAYLLFPVVGCFQRQFNKIPLLRNHSKTHCRALAIAVTGILTAAVIILLISLVISSVTHELTAASWDGITSLIGSVSNTLKNTQSTLNNWLSQMNIDSKTLNEYADRLTSLIGQAASSLGDSLTSFLSRLPGFLTNGVFAIIFAIYFLADYTGLEKYWDRVLKAFSPKKFYHGFHVFLQDADHVFSGYIRGQLMDALFIAIIMSVALSLENVKFGIVIGVLTGIGNLIPYVGPVVAYGCVIIVNLLEGDLQKLVISLITVFILQTVDGNVINPRFLSNNIHVHPMLVIAAIILGSAIGGFLGMLLAVPCAALIKLGFDRAVSALMKKRELAVADKKIVS